MIENGIIYATMCAFMAGALHFGWPGWSIGIVVVGALLFASRGKTVVRK